MGGIFNKMDIFKEMENYNVEQIIFNYDKSTGLKSIIAINDTTLGPALGGCRMWNYQNEDEALMDAIRLSKAMTYKCSIAGTNFGGGKTVIIGNPKTDKSETLFRALGRFIQMLNGRYYTGTDLGTTGEDFVYASQESKYFAGLPTEYGGSGDTAIPTAYGVYMGIKAAVKVLFNKDSLKNLTMAVQGVGKVGSQVVEHLIREDVNVLICDVLEENLKTLTDRYPNITVVDPDTIYEQECDVFVPCALGAIINDTTIPKLKCKIVAGSANNQLAELRHGEILHQKGILYAPDFVINSGGLIQVADELEMRNINHDRVIAKTKKIYDILLDIFKISMENDIPTYEVANKLAEERIETIGQIKRKYVRY
jgi:leucine dehydrogenase